MALRVSKAVLVFAIALFYTILVLNNITDHGSNYEFVRHVLIMDSRRFLHGAEQGQLDSDTRATPSRARASGVLPHGTGTETADELTLVKNHRPSIFLASPSRSTWLTAVQNVWPVAGFNATLK